MSHPLQQEQQGFYPSIPVISCLPYQQQTNQFQKPLDYQPRVLSSAGITYKLPVQMIQPFLQIPILQDPILNFKEPDRQSTNREQAKSPHEKYVKSGSYKLIYSKNNKIHFQNEQDFVKREIDLSCISNYSSHNYIPLKQQKIQAIKQNIKEYQSLIFDSSFQCGNLLCVYQSLKQQHSYECFVQKDTNTQGYNQWFYFSIQNMRKQVTYKFKIVNLSKKFSFLKMGMKIILFSYERHKKEGNGWFQRGYKIRYQSSEIFDVKYGQKTKLFSASFELNFDYSFDYVTLSLGVPYSYSRLIRQLKIFKSKAIDNNILWHQQNLCHTISNNQVPYITISKKSHATQEISIQTKKANKIIIIMARQHPGQTNSSFIMEKVLETLSLCANEKINWLLEKYQFRVFPMVNVDGVIYGNYRCDIVGFDLNRCWKNPIAQLHPQVSAIKRQIQNLKIKSKIVFCIDFHSHSKQFNVFSYCNKIDQIDSRLFSMILSKNCPFFNFPSCTFGLSRQKQSTARAVIGSYINNQNALTIQFSSFGYKTQGSCLMFDNKSFQVAALAIFASLKCFLSNKKEKKIILNQIQDNLSKLKTYYKKNLQVQSGSESDHIAQFDQLSQKLKIILPKELVLNIKKRLKEEKIKTQRFNKSATKQVKQQKIFTPKHNIQIRLNIPRKPILIANETKSLARKRQIQILTKKNIDKQAIIDFASYSWKPSQVNQRIKTDPKYYQQVDTLNNPSNIRYSTPNKMTSVCKSDFKHSLKMLCKELNETTSHKEDYDMSLAINNVRQNSQKQKYQQRNSKLQKILKVRRRTNNFKHILSRQPMVEEMTILKIRSQHSQSTMEAINPIFSPTSVNTKIDKFLISKQHFSNNNYVSHIHFLNKFLKTNIKDTINQKKEKDKDEIKMNIDSL